MRSESRTFEKARSHPSRGGNAYPLELRRLVVEQHRLGVFDFNSANAPCLRTVQSWMAREANEGTLLSYRKSGNVRADVLQGYDLFLLALFL